MSQFGFDSQLRVYSTSLQGQQSWSWPVSIEQWRATAKNTLAAGPWGYLEGGAGLETTMAANRAAFMRYGIQSRMLRNVEDRDLTVSFLGNTYPVPFFLAPIGVQSILHRDAELASTQAAAQHEVPFILSTVSSVPMEKVAEAVGDATRWFQLYPGKDKQVVSSFLNRAAKSGYSAIVVTVDTTMLGWRTGDLQNVYLPFLQGEGIANFVTDPAFQARLNKTPREDPAAAVQEFLSIYVNPAFTWEELSWIRSMTELPVFVKGIVHPEDAVTAKNLGMDGVIVSNHGGRQVDGGLAALDALKMVRAAVGDDYTVLMDSGIRSAADVYKAVALGANAILIGRPYAYALAAGGQPGVSEYIGQLKAELDLQLALSGYDKVRDIRSDYVQRMP